MSDMSSWWRRWRAYLVLAPLILVLGFGYNTYEAVTGNDDSATSPEDVPKGRTARYQGIRVQLTSLTTRDAKQGEFPDAPKDTVFVVAKFRGRIDDPAKAKKIHCTSTIENAAGWKWKSTDVAPPDVEDGTSSGCDGSSLDENFDSVQPPPHKWYDFAYGYVVPKERAQELRPTLSYYKEHPRYLRFES